MRILLDTPLFVWWLVDDKRLPAAADRLIADPGNEVFVSAASIWEISIQAALGQIQGEPATIQAAIEPSGFAELPITGRHALQVSRLPLHHRDPFDRMLVAQSQVEPLRLLTHDQNLKAYGDLVMLV